MPNHAEVWLASLDPVVGREQGGTRPVLIVSADQFNSSRIELVIIVPFTSKKKEFLAHVEVKPPEGGLTSQSWVKCEDVRSISTSRLVKKLGQVKPQTLADVNAILRKFLDL